MQNYLDSSLCAIFIQLCVRFIKIILICCIYISLLWVLKSALHGLGGGGDLLIHHQCAASTDDGVVFRISEEKSFDRHMLMFCVLLIYWDILKKFLISYFNNNIIKNTLKIVVIIHIF